MTTDTDVSYSRRTNVEIVADAVATLLHHGLIVRNDMTLARIRDLLGVSLEDLRRASTRRGQVKFRPITPAHHVSPPQPRAEFVPVDAKTPQANRRPQQMGPQGLELKCTGGVSDPPHWAVKGAFDARSDAPHRRMSKCRAHQLETQRARRISKDAVAALEAANLDLLYDSVGRAVGVECAVCGSKVECGCGS